MQQVDDKTLLLEDLDVTSINFRPYVVFIVLYVFNAVLSLPVFVIKMIIMFVQSLLEALKKFEIKEAIILTIRYAIDIAMALSILSMYLLVLFKMNYSVNYQYWAMICLGFQQCQILMNTFMQTLAQDKNDLELSYLFSRENMIGLGLGRLIVRYERSKESSEAQLEVMKKQFFEMIRQDMQQENIDSSFYYFALDSDHGLISIPEYGLMGQSELNLLLGMAYQKIRQEKKLQPTKEEHFEKQEVKEKMLSMLLEQGFRGQRHGIDNLLWPHYQLVRGMTYTSGMTLGFIVVVVLFLKGIYPVVCVMMYSDMPKFEYCIIALFIGMYINTLTLLIGLVVNDDLKSRKYILNVLETMLIPGKSADQDDVDDNNSVMTETPQDLPFNNRFKIDLSCNLSLETWDNVRRLTLMIDQNKIDTNEVNFMFLVFYFIFTYLNLSSVFMDFDLVPSLKHFFHNPILVSNNAVDFILLALLFINRINEGSLYNETFNRMQETIKQIALVYEDKKALFEFYFSSNLMESIQNPTYRRITQKIATVSADKVLFQLASKGIKQIDFNEFKILTKIQCKQRLLQLCATMSKLSIQLEFDSEQFAHKMFVYFKSDIMKLFSSFTLLLYIFFHSKIKSYLNSHKIKPEGEGKPHHHHNHTNISNLTTLFL